MQFALLKDGLCSIHDCKPTVCALFPLGRVVVNAQALESGLENGPVEVKYMLVDITSVAKDRKAPSGRKSRTREADDAAIFA